jgi:glycerol uptake facilitator-like aquaporin
LLATAIDDPVMRRYQNAGARRRLIGIHIALTLILATVPQLLYLWHRKDAAMPFWAFAVAAVLLFVPWMFVTGMVNGSVYGIFDLKDGQLDEVERQHRDAAYRTAYRVMIPVTMVGIGTVAGLVEGGRLAPAFWCGSILFALVLGLPQYIAAWRFAAHDSVSGATEGDDE